MNPRLGIGILPNLFRQVLQDFSLYKKEHYGPIPQSCKYSYQMFNSWLDHHGKPASKRKGVFTAHKAKKLDSSVQQLLAPQKNLSCPDFSHFQEVRFYNTLHPQMSLGALLLISVGTGFILRTFHLIRNQKHFMHTVHMGITLAIQGNAVSVG